MGHQRQIFVEFGHAIFPLYLLNITAHGRNRPPTANAERGGEERLSPKKKEEQIERGEEEGGR